jgi:hypothetical protein
MARRHLPVPVMAVLLGTAAIGVSMIGFGNGRVGAQTLTKCELTIILKKALGIW